MSFAAVAALVAVAEWEMAARADRPRGTLYRYVHGIVMTSLVGSLATMPFALFHFDRATHYAVLGNLIAMPVMGFWVMPAAALSVMADAVRAGGACRWHLLGRGIEVMLAMGRWVSGPAGRGVAGAGHAAVGAAADLAGRTVAGDLAARLALAGLGRAAAGGCAGGYAAPLPDMLVAPDAATVAMRGADGLLHFVRKPTDKYAARDWLRRDGDGRDVGRGGRHAGTACDGLGCVVQDARS